MKAELKLKPHNFGTLTPAGAANVVEVWFGGVMVGVVYGADGPGIRFVSKYPMKSSAITSAEQSMVEILTRPK